MIEFLKKGVALVKKHFVPDKKTTDLLLGNQTVELNPELLLGIIKNYKAIIVKITLISVLFGLIYSIITPNLYQSESTLYAVANNDNGSYLNKISGFASTFGLNIPVSGQNYDVIDIAYSDNLKEKILLKKWYFDSANDSLTFLEYLTNTNKSFLSALIWDDDTTYNSALHKGIKILDDRISANQDKETGLIEISFLAEEPELAKNVVLFMINKIQEFVQKTSNSFASKNKQFIGERLDQLKNELRVAENNLKDFLKENKNFLDSPGLRLQKESLQRVIDLKQSIYTALSNEFEMSRIEEVKATPIFNTLDKPLAPIKKKYPRRLIILFVSVLFGLSLSYFYLFIYLYIKKYSN